MASSWHGMVQEVAALKRPDGIDVVRRQKIARVEQVAGRHLLIYASDFATQHPIKAQFAGGDMSVTIMDKDGFDEITRNITEVDKGIDVFLHSPGGSAEATESIVELLRARFSNIRFIVPSIAKSAATMMVMSGNQILMDERSELGPIDPQLMIHRDNQIIVAPAQPAAARPSLRKPVRLPRIPPDLPGQTAQSLVPPYCEPLWQAIAAYQGSRHRWRALLGCPGVLSGGRGVRCRGGGANMPFVSPIRIRTRAEVYTSAAGQTTTVVRDAQARPLQLERPGFHPLQLTYDSRGRLLGLGMEKCGRRPPGAHH